MAKMEVCKASTATGGKCRDKTTKKFAKCGAPNTEPVPVATKVKPAAGPAKPTTSGPAKPALTTTKPKKP
jgi:hypothetical protein